MNTAVTENIQSLRIAIKSLKAAKKALKAAKTTEGIQQAEDVVQQAKDVVQQVTTPVYEAASQVVAPLVDVYLTELPVTPRGQALAEQAIWDSLSEDFRQAITAANSYYATWLVHCLKGGSSSRYLAKARLLKEDLRGHTVDTLWAYLDSPESNPSLILDTISFANDKAKEDPVDTEEGAKTRWSEVARDYLQNPVKRLSRIPKENRPEKPPKSKRHAKVFKRQKAFDAILTDGSPEEARKIWSDVQDSMQDLLLPFLQQRLNGFESPADIERRLEDFCLGVRVNYDDLLLSIRRLRNTTNSKDVVEGRRREIRRALEVLRVAPKRGWSKDQLDKEAIKKAYRDLSKQFHPDLNRNNDPRYHERYQEVQEAYRLLQQYINP